MLNLTTATFPRPTDLGDRADPAVLYARSYLLIRTVVGAIGILLPIVLWVVDALVLHGWLTARGSLSAYYHSGARDQRYGGRPRLHRACGIAILAAVAWVALGRAVDLDIGWLTSLYAGEVVSVWAFGTSWLVKGFDLLHVTRASVRSTPGL